MLSSSFEVDRGRLVRIRIAPLSAAAHARTAPADSTPIDGMRSAWPRSALNSGTRIAELLRRAAAADRRERTAL